MKPRARYGYPPYKRRTSRTNVLTSKGQAALEQERRLRLYPNLDSRDWPDGDWLVLPEALFEAAKDGQPSVEEGDD